MLARVAASGAAKPVLQSAMGLALPWLGREPHEMCLHEDCLRTDADVPPCPSLQGRLMRAACARSVKIFWALPAQLARLRQLPTPRAGSPWCWAWTSGPC